MRVAWYNMDGERREGVVLKIDKLSRLITVVTEYGSMVTLDIEDVFPCVDSEDSGFDNEEDDYE